LKSIAENIPTASSHVLAAFSHMLQVLGMQSCSWDELFNTDRAAATGVISEARMLEGIFKFCDAHNLRNVNVGGFRMDLKDAEEMNLWNDYIRTITASRRAHYDILTRETIHDKKSVKIAQLPMEHFPLDIVHGLINWKVLVSDVRQEIEAYANTYEDDTERTEVISGLDDWFKGHFFEDYDSDTAFESEPKYMYIPEGVGVMAHNMNTPGAYGMTLRIGDVACSVNVLKESNDSKSKLTTVWLYDPKHPGMGIDQCTGNLGQQCNAAMIHISMTKEHRDMAPLAVDTSLRNVSKMSFATFQGSGVLINASGEMIETNSDFVRKYGKTCYFTEYGNQAEDILVMGWMESLMANSGDQELGGESGVQQGSWQTTLNCESVTVLPIKKMSILLLTGNQPAPATPASAVEGA
jgi:hypothetical protein